MAQEENARQRRGGGGNETVALDRGMISGGAILEAMAEAVVACDLDGRIVAANLEARRLAGREVLAQPLAGVFGLTIHSDRHADAKAFLEQPLRGERVRGVPARITCGDQTMMEVLLTGGPLRDAEGRITGCVVTLDDNTAGKQTEEALKKCKETAEAANRTKDVFLAALAHELRAPLTPILSCCSAMEQREDLPADVREQMEIVCRNVRLAGRLTEDLLDVTRIGQGKLDLDPRPVNVHELIQYALEACLQQNRAESEHEVRVEPGASRHQVRADAARLQQVFWNLIHNAMKFTPAGGRITIRTFNQEPDSEWSGPCSGCGSPAPPELVIEVSDSGMGIEPEVMGRLFTEFEQADRDTTRRYGGLGLGLAISRRLVELHGGRLWARSEGRGRGATFTVELPLVVGATQASPSIGEPDTEQEPRARHASPLRILLVEDHADTARVLSLLLKNRGHRVEIAPSRMAAIEMAGRQSFDLVLCDLTLPDGSGLDLMRQLGRDYHLKGIAVSGHGTAEDVARSREAGFAEHLVKPVDFPDLEAAIARAAAGGAAAASHGEEATNHRG